MATIRLTRQSRSRGKKRRQIYHAEITCEQMNWHCACDHCKQVSKPWTNFYVKILQNQKTYLYPRLDGLLGIKIQKQIAVFLPPKKRLCVNCMYKKIERANLVLGLRQRYKSLSIY